MLLSTSVVDHVNPEPTTFQLSANPSALLSISKLGLVKRFSGPVVKLSTRPPTLTCALSTNMNSPILSSPRTLKSSLLAILLETNDTQRSCRSWVSIALSLTCVATTTPLSSLSSISRYTLSPTDALTATCAVYVVVGDIGTPVCSRIKSLVPDCPVISTLCMYLPSVTGPRTMFTVPVS